MYIPKLFREDDRAAAFDLIDNYGFATLVSWPTSGPMVSHLPLILERAESGGERILGHVARANNHWQAFDGASPALAIFHGPHAYISPAWYATHPSVPTWNYAVVHIHGVPKVLDEGATRAIIDQLVEKYEASRRGRWVPDLPTDFMATNLRTIVGFELPIARIEAKFKLGQNRELRDREGALAGLEAEDDPEGVALAAFARSYYRRVGR